MPCQAQQMARGDPLSMTDLIDEPASVNYMVFDSGSRITMSRVGCLSCRLVYDDVPDMQSGHSIRIMLVGEACLRLLQERQREGQQPWHRALASGVLPEGRHLGHAPSPTHVAADPCSNGLSNMQSAKCP